MIMNRPWQTSVYQASETIRTRSPRPVSGCTRSEVDQLQAALGVNLPAAYVDYLLAIGKDCGTFLMGSDLHFGELRKVRDDAVALLEEESGPTLPLDAFIFCGHQGYQFLFFRVTGDEDPPVEYYLEGQGEFKVVAASFSEWLARTVKEEFPEVT